MDTNDIAVKIEVALTREQVQALLACGGEFVLKSFRDANTFARDGKPDDAERLRADARVAAGAVDTLTCALKQVEAVSPVSVLHTRRPV